MTRMELHDYGSSSINPHLRATTCPITVRHFCHRANFSYLLYFYVLSLLSIVPIFLFFVLSPFPLCPPGRSPFCFQKPNTTASEKPFLAFPGSGAGDSCLSFHKQSQYLQPCDSLCLCLHGKIRFPACRNPQHWGKCLTLCRFLINDWRLVKRCRQQKRAHSLQCLPNSGRGGSMLTQAWELAWANKLSQDVPTQHFSPI